MKRLLFARCLKQLRLSNQFATINKKKPGRASMKIQLDPSDLRPLVELCVTATLNRLEGDAIDIAARMKGIRLREAATRLGVLPVETEAIQ